MDKRNGLVLGLMVVCLSGCGAIKSEHKEREGEADLARISRWLPGAYDNTAQVKSDQSKGVNPAHDAVELNVVTVDSIAVGRSAFYMQETAADDPMRVFSQRVITFNVTKKGVVQTVNTLVDPLRWRNGYREPDIFEGMTPRDFKPASGCEITWTREEKPVDPKAKKLSKEDAAKEAEHARYIGVDDSKHCEMTSHAVMGLVNMELRGEITSNEIDLAELQYDSDGKLIPGSTADPFYRFHREGK